MAYGQGGSVYNSQVPSYTPSKPKPKPTAEDPIEQLNLLIASLSQGDDDYYADASRIYAPQFSYLDQLSQNAQNQAAASKKDLSGLYGALQAGIKGQEGGIKKNYAQGINDVGSAYNQALAALDAQFDQTRSGSAEELERLGIQQAGSNVAGKSNQMEALLSGILGANQMGTQNALRQGQQAAVTYNTQQAGAAGLAGAEAQKGLARQLGDFLQQISGKQADLQSQVHQTAFGMEENAQKSALQAAQDQYKRMIDERDFQYRMGKDKADYDLALQAASATKDNTKLDPVGKMQQVASSLYGNQQAAGNAMNAVMDALMAASQDGKKPPLGVLLAELEERLAHVNGGKGPGDWSNLQRLAAMLYE